MSLKFTIEKEGYVVLKNVFSEEEISHCVHDIHQFKKEHTLMQNAGGHTIPNFIRFPELEYVANLRNSERLQNALCDIFDGDDYRFCEHNDIGINRIVGWHKDKLNGNYAKYENVPIWSTHDGEKHEIVKVLIYLEDHSHDNDGLKVVPRSHIKPIVNPSGFVQLKPSLGDVVIFDQRITHRGMTKQVKGSRILVAFGYGKNNVFTDNFERGTIRRQTDQS